MPYVSSPIQLIAGEMFGECRRNQHLHFSPRGINASNDEYPEYTVTYRTGSPGEEENLRVTLGALGQKAVVYRVTPLDIIVNRAEHAMQLGPRAVVYAMEDDTPLRDVCEAAMLMRLVMEAHDFQNAGGETT